MRRLFLSIALVASALASAGAQSAPMNDEEIEARTSKVAAQLRCVVCQGQSLQESPSDLAQQMRAVVKEQVAAGKSDDEIKRYFVEKYGEWILLEPQPHGFNIVAWLLPPVALIVGGVLLTLRMRRWSATRPDVQA
jgi:cytochrome c-type biogenesis protein CcmH